MTKDLIKNIEFILANAGIKATDQQKQCAANALKCLYLNKGITNG